MPTQRTQPMNTRNTCKSVGIQDYDNPSYSNWVTTLAIPTPDVADPVLAEIVAAVAALPIPPEPPARWTARTCTVAWLHSRVSPHTRRAYFNDIKSWLQWC